MKAGGSCGVSSAAIAEVSLGSGIFARPPSLGPKRERSLAAEEN